MSHRSRLPVPVPQHVELVLVSKALRDQLVRQARQVGTFAGQFIALSGGLVNHLRTAR